VKYIAEAYIAHHRHPFVLQTREEALHWTVIPAVSTRFPCYLQRFHCESAVRRERHCPAHRFSCEQIENNGEVRPALTSRDIGHITAPHLIWLRYGELSLKMIRDGNVLVTATLISVGGLLTTHQSQLFHEPDGKLAPHLIASLSYHSGDASCSG